MKWLLLLLFVLCIINVAVDYKLTEYALNNGFYETNKFTQQTSPLIHLVVLSGIIILVFMLGFLIKTLTNISIAALLLFGLIWTINNVYSLTII